MQPICIRNQCGPLVRSLSLLATRWVKYSRLRVLTSSETVNPTVEGPFKKRARTHKFFRRKAWLIPVCLPISINTCFKCASLLSSELKLALCVYTSWKSAMAQVGLQSWAGQLVLGDQLFIHVSGHSWHLLFKSRCSLASRLLLITPFSWRICRSELGF